MIRTFESLSPRINASAYVDESAVIIGDVGIAADVSIWPMTVVRGDIHAIRIGEGSNIQDGSVLHVTHDGRYKPGGSPLQVGRHVTVGHHVTLHGCTVGDETLIGMGSVILDDAVIEAQSMIAAGSLVTSGKRIEGGWLWMGRPAKRIRELTDGEREYLRYAAEHYVRLKDRYRQSEKA